MAQQDYLKAMKHLYTVSAKQPVIVEVPPMPFLMIDGQGDPNTSRAYQEAVEALYSLSYTLKFAIKKQRGLDYKVMPLEGLWWVEDMSTFSVEDKNRWQWTMMIMQPISAIEDCLEAVFHQVERKKNPPALYNVRLEYYGECLAGQIMHLGPYSTEAPTVQTLHEFIEESGGELTGKHHEIYLSDPRKSAPENMKTIIRQPMRRQH